MTVSAVDAHRPADRGGHRRGAERLHEGGVRAAGRHRRAGRDDGDGLSAAGRQAAARAVWLDSHRAGQPLSGAQLGARFARSRSWGNARICEARTKEPDGQAGTTRPTHQAHEGAGLATNHTSPSELAVPSGQRAAASRDLAPPVDPPRDRPVPAVSRPTAGAGRLDTLIVAVVALVAAAASYEHQRHLAAAAGEGALSWVLPVSVDGMMLATSRSILRRRRAAIRVPAISWLGFTLGLVASVAANVAAAEPTWVGRLLAAWPPLALFIAYETLAADHGEFRP
jgi:hypothetical protein